jgi:hypothetical protein
MTESAVVAVPRLRLVRWVANFADRHGGAQLTVEDGALRGVAADGSDFTARLPFATSYDGPAAAEDLAAAVTAPAAWGVLLVRKGGFAVARLERERIVESKVGQRHVQGRTKAGGQSQQRFARRRDNQARQAYEAAAEHAARVLAGLPPRAPLVTGGDHTAVEAVLEDPRLRPLAARVVGPWLAVPDPRRAVLEQAVADAMAAQVAVHNA